MDATKLVYRLLAVGELNEGGEEGGGLLAPGAAGGCGCGGGGGGFQAFVDLLHQAAEESGTMSLDDETLDDLVPLGVLEDFVGAFVHSLDDWMCALTRWRGGSSPVPLLEPSPATSPSRPAGSNEGDSDAADEDEELCIVEG
jgi:hypothetical protein|eukprot:SAG25_NODE_241_length_11184_cov_4.090934_8_plen_142_part_00